MTPLTATDANEPPAMRADLGSLNLTYTLSGTDAASFLIDRTDGTVNNKAELDYETKNSYMVTVTATDSDGLSASIDVTITVTDVDEAPEIIVGGLAISGPSSASYAENGTEPVATYTLAGPKSDSGRWTLLSGDDGTDFRISNSGVLTFVRTPDFENPADADMDNVYRVTLTARDSEPNTATRDVVVTVTNVVGDEPVIGGTLLERYDVGGSEGIDRSEVITAINDYFDGGEGAPSKDDVITIINLYFDNTSATAS